MEPHTPVEVTVTQNGQAIEIRFSTDVGSDSAWAKEFRAAHTLAPKVEPSFYPPISGRTVKFSMVSPKLDQLRAQIEQRVAYANRQCGLTGA